MHPRSISNGFEISMFRSLGSTNDSKALLCSLQPPCDSGTTSAMGLDAAGFESLDSFCGKSSFKYIWCGRSGQTHLWLLEIINLMKPTSFEPVALSWRHPNLADTLMPDVGHPPPIDSNAVHHLVSTIQNIALMFDFLHTRYHILGWVYFNKRGMMIQRLYC